MNKKNIITWVLFFLVFFAIMQFFSKKAAPVTPQPESSVSALEVTSKKDSYASGEEVIIKVKNNTAASIIIPSKCPKNPLRVLTWIGEKFEEKGVETKVKCELAPAVTVQPNAEANISFNYWNYSLFGNTGRYKVEFDLGEGKDLKTFSSTEFTVVEAGFWRKLFRTALYQPIYNALIFLISIAPARDLGFAIIVLTILMRLVLLIPSQRAIVSQRKMQELQPKLEAVKKKYVGNQERIAQETMALWKEHKVNPFGSCLPILVQFPVLIALFYVIQSGINPDNVHYVYDPLKNVDLTNIHTNFLGILELTRVNVFVLPIIIGALQFFQLKLTTWRKKKQDDDKAEQPKSEMETANKMMTYVMPVMIAVFTASVPAGVGLYWGISTAYAIGQQKEAKRKI